MSEKNKQNKELPKEENIAPEKQNKEKKNDLSLEERLKENEEKDLESKKKEVEKLTPEEELENLKDKLARTFAEMENQRRRFEKERDDAYEYGGYSFAKEALNLLDNLERSKAALENDEKLKDTEALKKILEHLNIIHNDMLSIFKKNNIKNSKE